MMGALDDARTWWDAAAEGAELPEVELPISYAKVVAISGATWDFFPGHHDPFYAREQGQETIYLSTMFYSGFLDRIVTDWAGEHAFIRARELAMTGSVYAGELLVGRGQVTEKRIEPGGMRVLDVAVSAVNESGAGAQGLITITHASELATTATMPSGEILWWPYH
jgi:acyl dehydratase